MKKKYKLSVSFWLLYARGSGINLAADLKPQTTVKLN